MASNINLNVTPYHDDFDEDNNFHRILFKPGFAVQARELTQLQTILQDQIEKFGTHIFDEGTIVLGGQFNVETTVDYVRVNTVNDLASSITDVEGAIIAGQTNGVKAYVYASALKEDWSSDNDVLMVRYISSSPASSTFVNSENIIVQNTGITFSTANAASTGKGTVFEIDEGVAFINGYFVKFAKQRIVISPTSETPSAVVGFNTVESIVSYESDTSLLDPALGSYNYSAPGADRLKVQLQLVKYDIGEVPPKTFFPLFTMKNGIITEIRERTSYSRLGDEFAKRTFDESGNYVVRGFTVRSREHLDTGVNEGYLPAANGGNSSLLVIGVDPGLAYIQGYEVNKLVTEYIETEKSTAFKHINSEVISATNGNYIRVRQLVGNPVLDKMANIGLYDTAETRVANSVPSTTAPTGSQIGTAKIKSFIYEDDDEYRLYLSDVSMIGSNVFSNVKSVYSGADSGFFADVTLSTANTASLSDVATSSLLYRLGSNFTRTIRASDDTVDTTFTFRKSITPITIDSSGVFTVTVDTASETHSYGSSGTLDSLAKNTILLTFNEAANVSMPGTINVNVSISNTEVYGIGTDFTVLNVGDRIVVSNTAGYYKVAAITANNRMTVDKAFTATFSGNTYVKQYLAGDKIDMNQKGAASGVNRTVTATTNKILTFDMKETLPESYDATVSFNATRSTAREVSKTLRPNRYVMINCIALSSNTAPINLGISDVYRLRSIRSNTAIFTSNTDGVDITSSFIFDNGQRDEFYDHASITPKTTTAVSPSENNNYLLIELDYFYPDFTQGAGYFSVDSYPVDDANVSSTTIFTQDIPTYRSPTTGISYDLKNCLDFRPVKVFTASDSTTVAGATLSPSTTNNFNVKDAYGLRIVAPGTQITCDYSYYLARRDVLICDKDGNFNIFKGIPSENPVSPSTPDGVMGVARVYIPPYPSLSGTYARILGNPSIGVATDKITYDRHTMKDIGVLKQRIENLEYYNALNLLEKNVNDMLILDENGLDRFKNGFFVDPFIDHSLGATYNNDYNICVDRKETVIRPIFEMDSFKYNPNPVSITNAVATGNLITLPYTQTSLVEQAKATTIRNVEQSVYRFVGKLFLSPDIDTWVDTTTVDKTIDIGNDTQPSKILKTEWNSWETNIVGVPEFRVYSRQAGDRQSKITASDKLIGTFSSYEAAVRAADKVSRAKIEIVDTFQQTRSGVSTVTSFEKRFQSIGEFVTDVSIIPYIRPTIITILARGLKANTQFFTFFDNEDMNSYVSPIVDGEVQAEGSDLYSDSEGTILAQLRLPSEGKRFRMGTKEVTLTDSPTNAVDASTYAKGYYVATGLNATKQNTILSTRHTISKEVIVYDSAKLKKNSKIEIFGPSCMAYTFKVDLPENESGAFITSVDVFIKSKHPTLGIWFEIREMSNDGGITRTQVPYSEVWYTSDQITTTDDATTPHTVTFPSPVYLLNDTQYAFVIHTEGINPDYYFWVSRLGETDILTGNQVTGRPLTGTLFTTNNNLNWDAVPDVDLKFNVKRAVFDTEVTGTVVVGNERLEMLNISEPDVQYTLIGETVGESYYVTLSDVVGSNTIVVGDKFVWGSNTANVVGISGSIYYTDSFNIAVGDSVSVNSSTDVIKSITANVATSVGASGTLREFNNDLNSILLENSTGTFAVNSYVQGVRSGITEQITGYYSRHYNAINIKPKSLRFPRTFLDFHFRGVKTGETSLDSTWTDITPDNTQTLDNEYSLYSRTVEVSSFSGANSTQMRAVFSTDSEYVSPVIDMNGASAVFIRNIVNNDVTDETDPSGGALINKYISKTVTLAEGQDAEDLMVSLTAYIPPTTDVKVWMKLINAEDTAETIAQKPWYEMTRRVSGVFSSISNLNDFISITYDIPANMLTGTVDTTTGIVQYTSNGNTFTGFKQFAIKIGLLASDSSIVPRVGDLQVIALQK